MMDGHYAKQLVKSLRKVQAYCAGHKTADGLQDLKKAAWYLDREIKRMERQ